MFSLLHSSSTTLLTLVASSDPGVEGKNRTVSAGRYQLAFGFASYLSLPSLPPWA